MKAIVQTRLPCVEKIILTPDSPSVIRTLTGYERTNYVTNVNMFGTPLKSLFIEGVSFPNTMYNVTSENNLLHFIFPAMASGTVLGVPNQPIQVVFSGTPHYTQCFLRLVIPVGFYTINQLINEINLQLSLQYVDMQMDIGGVPTTVRVFCTNRFQFAKQLTPSGGVYSVTTNAADSIPQRVYMYPGAVNSLVLSGGIPTHNAYVAMDMILYNSPTGSQLMGWQNFGLPTKTLPLGAFVHNTRIPLSTNLLQPPYTLLMDELGWTADAVSTTFISPMTFLAQQVFNIMQEVAYLTSQYMSDRMGNGVRNFQSNVMAAIPITVPYGNYLYYQPNEMKRLNFLQNNGSDFDVGLINEYGYPIDLHGGSLRVYLLVTDQEASYTA